MRVESRKTRPLELADLKRFVAGADVFSRQSDGTTIAAQYAKHGISLRVANTDRVNGWAEVLQGFGEPNVGLADGGVRPTLFIHKRCARLIETLPTLQHDPNRPEDVLKVDRTRKVWAAMMRQMRCGIWWRQSRGR